MEQISSALPKVLVVGNCQARPLAAIFERTGRFECLPPIILHLAKAQARDAHIDQIARADIILAQQTAPTFALPHLRSDRLRAEHSRTIVWPNVFYSGQQPFARYMTHIREGRLFGPLEAIHDLRFYLRWRHDRGHSSHATFPQNFATQVAITSLTELKKREAACDVAISDVIMGQSGSAEPLFFTFNHPANQILWQLARRILSALDEPDDVPFDSSIVEALGRYVVPSTWTTTDTLFQGDRIELEASTGSVHRIPGPPQRYSGEALEALFFDVYDQNPAFHDLNSLRFTPEAPCDEALLKGEAP